MTGTLSRIGRHLGLALVGASVPGSEGDAHLHRARMDAQIWASLIISAALSGAPISPSRNTALWPAVAVMLLIALAGAFVESSHKAQPKATGKGPTKAENVAPAVTGDAQTRIETPPECEGGRRLNQQV